MTRKRNGFLVALIFLMGVWPAVITIAFGWFYLTPDRGEPVPGNPVTIITGDQGVKVTKNIRKLETDILNRALFLGVFVPSLFFVSGGAVCSAFYLLNRPIPEQGAD